MLTSSVRPRPAARWLEPVPQSPDVVSALCAATGLPERVCTLLATRGYTEPEAAKAFLRPRLEQLHAPGLMTGMATAVDRLSRAIAAQEVILVHGDYDVDGICSTTILVRAIRLLGGTAEPFIPHRLSDGYDLTEAGVNAARAIGARVVVTADCGTSALGPVGTLTREGVDVIVTDHHLPGGPLPDCLAVLNPRAPGCSYPDKDLCAAGVSFKLVQSLLAAHRASANIALHMLDLVALATVADVAPLRGENRVLVRLGLKLLGETRTPGLRALVQAAGLEGKPMTAGRVGFILAPRLNAAGRLGHALRGVELMLADDAGTANGIARELEELNRARQALDKQTLDEARGRALELDLDKTFGVVLAAEGWHPGVIGIVASRLVDELCRPVILISLEGGIGKGSGRSISAFDLHAGLSACRDLMLRFGGHRVAAGLTIESSRIGELAERFNAVARERLRPEDLVPDLRLDAQLALGDASEELEGLLRHFEPFGVGNPAPVLASTGVRLLSAPRTVGQNGLKVRLGVDGGSASIDGIWWGGAERAREFAAGDEVEIAYRLERDAYGRDPRLVARLLDMRH